LKDPGRKKLNRVSGGDEAALGNVHACELTRECVAAKKNAELFSSAFVKKNKPTLLR
jgi:hypothetical protein